MIISCPECAGPFEVTDDRIAALVQVACPHCAFRMILDFEAANDPGLVEQGMRMASGFRSASDYHASVGASAGVQPTTGPELVEDENEDVAVEATPTPTPVAAERRAATPIVTAGVPPIRVPTEPRIQPTRPARREASEEARTEVHMLPQGAERLVPVDIPPVRRPPVARDEDDIDVRVPAPATERVRGAPEPATDEVAIDIDEDEPATQLDLPPMRPEPAQASPQAIEPAASASASDQAAHPAFGDDEDEDMPTIVVPPEARDAASLAALAAARRGRGPERAPEPEVEVDQTPSGRNRLPPHTPPGRAKVAARGEEETTPADRKLPKLPVGEQPSDDDEEVQIERMSTFGVVMVLLLVLLAGGLVGASIALNDGHNPDPRPLLEKLYRQYVKGQ